MTLMTDDFTPPAEPRTVPLPETLRLVLNGVPLAPYCDDKGRIYDGTWVLPGNSERITTTRAQSIARAKGWSCIAYLN